MVQADLKKIVIICGPTAVGKSAFAMELARQHNGEIVSADSAQVYRELDLGTGKPTPADRRNIPHHLIDVADPNEIFHASRYLELADRAIADINRRGKLPIVVGGCGLYLRVLLQGLCEAPSQDRELRARLTERIEAEGLEALYRELQTVDPEGATKIHPQDKTRIERGLEVYQLTGKPLSYFHKKHQTQQPRYQAQQIGLYCERSQLHHKIEQRVEWMMASGWVEEVRELLKFVPSDSQALQTIGYRQIVQHLKGNASLPDTIAEIKKQTKAYARRQLTWFRRVTEIQWFTLVASAALILPPVFSLSLPAGP